MEKLIEKYSIMIVNFLQVRLFITILVHFQKVVKKLMFLTTINHKKKIKYL